jgi:lipopolysaccharide export system protein LptA
MAKGLIRITACLAIAAVVASSALPALAQSSTSTSTSTSKIDGLKLSKDKPIQIESDHLEVHDQDKKAFFDGNVKVVQGTMTLNAAHMIVFYNGKGGAATSGQGDIQRIEVKGQVTVFNGTQSAKGDEGSFEMATQFLTLTGKQVVLVDGPNVFTGCKLTVEMKTGLTKLDNCGGRVKISIDPQSNKKN